MVLSSGSILVLIHKGQGEEQKKELQEIKAILYNEGTVDIYEADEVDEEENINGIKKESEGLAHEPVINNQIEGQNEQSTKNQNPLEIDSSVQESLLSEELLTSESVKETIDDSLHTQQKGQVKKEETSPNSTDQDKGAEDNNDKENDTDAPLPF